ncbi:Nn.00g073750.m01.CDS01 [Neocucurbitaria sp. VM-36]
MEPTYTPIGISDSDEHPGKPASMPFYIAAPLNFAYAGPATYLKNNPTPLLTLHRVVDAVKTLYHLNPVYDGGTAFDKPNSKQACEPATAKVQFQSPVQGLLSGPHSAGLLNASAEFVSVVPVRLESRIHEPSTFAICHYSPATTLTSGLQTILPLCLWVFGGKVTRSKSNETTPYRRQWDR